MADQSKRATIYFEPSLHQTIRIKSAETNTSISAIVNDAIRLSLLEDAEDLEDFNKRAKEPNLLFEDVLKEMKKSGKL